MSTTSDIKEKISQQGFAIIESVFASNEIDSLLSAISEVDSSTPTFRRSNDLYAVRQFLIEVPATIDLIFKNKLNRIIKELFSDEFFVVKSIYFDKPSNSNWFVSFHQDLTISVDKKLKLDGYGPWTTKHNQFAVQPPVQILQDNFTIRIHLDDTGKENGALRVIPKSHLKGICRPETIDWTKECEVICNVPKGGIMIMRPLLLHSSGRTTNGRRRRVIHIEFSRSRLPEELKWSEFISINS
jgi:ectoine hydroxylase-related dioxygenase (phytanoyl-CoA dioxygenase family)